MYLIRLIAITICALIGTSLSGQGTTNPFDIEGRAPVSQEVSIDIDTAKTSTEADIEVSAATDEVGEEKAPISLEENPFEVDHIPYRRSELRNKKAKEKAAQVEAERPTLGKNFLFWINLIVWALLALILAQDRMILTNLWKTVTNENLLKLHKRDKGINQGNLLLYLVYLISMASFAYLIYGMYYPDYQPNLWLKIFGIVTAIYAVRHLFYYLLGIIFDIDKEASLYNHVIYTNNIIIGICLLPIILLLAFGPESIHEIVMYIGIGVIAILLLLRYLRGLTISLKFITGSFLLFFVYLCVAEISPIILLYKGILAR